jgi:carbonic anhydrase
MPYTQLLNSLHALENPNAAQRALMLLLEGNRRFAAGTPQYPNQDIARRAAALMLQEPVATVLGCTDSRVPVELVFDQGIGDLFVVRTAGCALDTVALGGLEYAVEVLHTPLIVVLGHSRCGAVGAALTENRYSENLDMLLDQLRPAIRALPPMPADQRWEQAVFATALVQCGEILARSQLLAEKHRQGKLDIIAACYHLETGVVSVLS